MVAVRFAIRVSNSLQNYLGNGIKLGEVQALKQNNSWLFRYIFSISFPELNAPLVKRWQPNEERWSINFWSIKVFRGSCCLLILAALI